MTCLRELVNLEDKSPLEIITFTQNLGLLARTVTCSCGLTMKLSPRSDTGDKYSWKCSSICRKQKSIRNGTWFSKSTLSLPKILLLTYMWVHRYPPRIAVKEVPCAQHTVIDWYNFCREICVEVVSSNEIQIGGPGKIVEMDEFGKRIYHRGKHVKRHWVFGGVERDSNKCFLRVVENRSADTLVPLIQKHIAPGTTIISDCWKACDCLGSKGFKHLTVNHSITFKNVETGAHNNTVKGMWGTVKRMFPDCNRTVGMFSSYWAQFMYLQMHKNSEDLFLQFTTDLAAKYSPGFQCSDAPQMEESNDQAGPSKRQKQ